jgi:hypothetical protein
MGSHTVFRCIWMSPEVSLEPLFFFVYLAHAALLIPQLEWTSGDNTQVVQWDTSSSGGISYHRFYRETEGQLQETSDMASWGNWYLATASDSSVSLPDPNDDWVEEGTLTTPGLVDLADWPRHSSTRSVCKQQSACQLAGDELSTCESRLVSNAFRV